MPKQDVMDIWSALQWVVREQKADRAFAANDDVRMLTPGGSVTGALMQIGELRARVDGGGILRGADLDPDAERIWMAVLMLDAEWRAGRLGDAIGSDIPVRMQRYIGSNRIDPVRDTVMAARAGDMPDWRQAAFYGATRTRRHVEESRLEYIMVWDVLSVLATRLQTSTMMGIVIELPGIPRLPWNSRKKMFDKWG